MIGIHSINISFHIPVCSEQQQKKIFFGKKPELKFSLFHDSICQFNKKNPAVFFILISGFILHLFEREIYRIKNKYVLPTAVCCTSSIVLTYTISVNVKTVLLLLVS